jgi:hypothetical protein
MRTKFGAIRLYCGSNDNPTVGQFVDALKTSIINDPASSGLCGNVRMMVLLFWIMYDHFSGHLMPGYSSHIAVEHATSCIYCSNVF